MKKLSETYKSGMYRSLFLVVILSVANTLSLTMPGAGLVIALAETAIWIFYFISNRMDDFILSYFLFSSTLIESNLFSVGTRDAAIYSFISLPGLAYYHIFFILFIAYIRGMFLNGKRVPVIQNRFSTRVALIFPAFCVVTFCTLAADDNGVYSLPGLLRFVIIDAYNVLWFCLVFAITWDCIEESREFIFRLKQLFLSVLTGVTIAAVILILLGKTHSPNYTATYLQCPIILFFSPALILFYDEKKHGGLYLLSGIFSILIQVKYTVGIPGAWWITTMLFVGAFYVRIIRGLVKSRTSVYFFCIAGCSVIVFLGGIVGLHMLLEQESESYIGYKLRTFMNIFSISGGSENWYISLGASIGIRLEELVNIIITYSKNPWFLFLGKGFGGSVHKYWGINNWNVAGATFSDVEIKYGVFSTFHVGLFELMINFGLAGIITGFIWIGDCIRSLFGTNKYLLIGTAWALIFLYFFHSMFICIACLCYGYYLKRNS